MIKEESRWGRRDGIWQGARESRWAINLSSSSPFLPSSCPMKGNHLGTPVLRRKRGRESPLGPLIFGIPAFWWVEGLLCKGADGNMGCFAFLHCCGLEVCYRARHGMQLWCRWDIRAYNFNLSSSVHWTAPVQKDLATSSDPELLNL